MHFISYGRYTATKKCAGILKYIRWVLVDMILKNQTCIDYWYQCHLEDWQHIPVQAAKQQEQSFLHYHTTLYESFINEFGFSLPIALKKWYFSRILCIFLQIAMERSWATYVLFFLKPNVVLLSIAIACYLCHRCRCILCHPGHLREKREEGLMNSHSKHMSC